VAESLIVISVVALACIWVVVRATGKLRGRSAKAGCCSGCASCGCSGPGGIPAGPSIGLITIEKRSHRERCDSDMKDSNR
jgi:hypothetical protein